MVLQFDALPADVQAVLDEIAAILRDKLPKRWHAIIIAHTDTGGVMLSDTDYQTAALAIMNVLTSSTGTPPS